MQEVVRLVKKRHDSLLKPFEEWDAFDWFGVLLVVGVLLVLLVLFATSEGSPR